MIDIVYVLLMYDRKMQVGTVTSNYIVCTWYCVHGILSLSLSLHYTNGTAWEGKETKNARGLWTIGLALTQH